MEIKLENYKLETIIGQLTDLMGEKVSMGVKNRLQKIVRELDVHLKDYRKLHVEMLKAHGATENDGKLELADVSQAFIEEYNDLSKQSNTIKFDPVDFSKIEDLQSDKVYDFVFLADFFENI